MSRPALCEELELAGRVPESDLWRMSNPPQEIAPQLTHQHEINRGRKPSKVMMQPKKPARTPQSKRARDSHQHRLALIESLPPDAQKWAEARSSATMAAMMARAKNYGIEAVEFLTRRARGEQICYSCRDWKPSTKKVFLIDRRVKNGDLKLKNLCRACASTGTVERHARAAAKCIAKTAPPKEAPANVKMVARAEAFAIAQKLRAVPVERRTSTQCAFLADAVCRGLIESASHRGLR